MLDDLAGWVAEETALDLTIGRTLFLGRMPDTPDRCVALYATVGAPPGEHFGHAAGADVEQPGVRMHVRHVAFDAGATLAHNVWHRLSDVTNEVLGGWRYLDCAPIQSPFPYERDDRGRTGWMSTFAIKRQAV